MYPKRPGINSWSGDSIKGAICPAPSSPVNVARTACDVRQVHTTNYSGCQAEVRFVRLQNMWCMCSPSLSIAVARSRMLSLPRSTVSVPLSLFQRHSMYNMSLGNGGSGNGQETQASSQPQPLFLCRPTTVLRRPDLHCVELGRRAPCSGRAASVPGRRSAVLLLLAERVRRTGHPEAARIQLMVW